MTYMFHGFCGQTAHCVIRNFNETSFDSSLMVVGWLRGGGLLHRGPEPVWVRPWLISAAELSSQRRSGAATWTRCLSLPPPGHSPSLRLTPLQYVKKDKQ